MGAVADMFDHNSEGYIDWKEFIGKFSLQQ